MRAVTRDEVRLSCNSVHGASSAETRRVMEQMSREQPFLQAYIAAICQRDDFKEPGDADAFANLATIAWHAMRSIAGGALRQVTGEELDACEARILSLYDYAQGEPEQDWGRLVEVWMQDYNQRPLLEFMLESLMSPENPYGVTPEGSGLIFTYVKAVIDCLDDDVEPG
jgi:hypothetical protein